ncbi:IS3 family transposase [Neobacillus pocheonensis]|uniref:IS3 family transposase n=1 Tax=Neobacillus pocheonensis TaxID=363869 RepID=A0ABT0WEB5_9BACI|nr:IS3 family transposase [Neobacillus pocheonensis]
MDKRVVIQIAEELRKWYSLTAILKVLEIPRSTYYRWLKGFAEYRNEHEDLIIEICKATNYRNGHRKIRAILMRQHHIHLNRNTVQKIMQKHHLQCKVKPKRKRKSQGESEVIAPNILKRDFSATKPNEKWVTDITYIQYGSETLYLSTIMDLYNNEIVAYKLYNHQQTSLVVDTLVETLNNRNQPEGVILHSDQGSVYTSYAYQNNLKQFHLISSMSRRGNCWDNAVIESFHSNIKTEEFQYCKFNSLSNLAVVTKIDKYIYHYNEKRIQEKLGYLTPKEFGNKAA